MPTSDITSVAMRQEWFVGDVRTYQSAVTTSAGPIFNYDITLDPIIPYIERVNFYAQPTAVDGTDENGIYYGGVYKPDPNDITVTGSGLTNSQKALIRSSLSHNISPQPGGEDRFALNITPLAAAGIQFFSIVIPYEETVIVNNSPLIEIPFLTIQGTSSAADPTTITVDQTNDKVIIDAGYENDVFPAVRIENIANGRTFNSATSEKSAGDFTVSWEEDISDRPLLVVDNNFSIQPTTLSSYTYGMNYRYRAQVNGSDLYLTVARQAGRVPTGGSSVEMIPQFMSISSARGVSGTVTISGQSTMDISFTCTGSTSDRTMNIVQMRNLNHAASWDITYTFTSTYIQVESIGRQFGGGLGPVSEIVSIPPGATIETAMSLFSAMCNSMGRNHGVGTLLLFSNPTTVGQGLWAHVNFTTIVVPYNGGLGYSSPLTYVAPLLTTPRTTQINLANHTISSLQTAIRSFFTGYPNSTFVAYTGLNWSNMPARILQNGVSTFASSSSPTLTTNASVNVGGEFEDQTHVFHLPGYSDISSLASAVNTAISTHSATCAAGLYYGSLDPSSYLLNGYDSGTINSLIDTPSFLNVEAAGGTTWSDSHSVTLDGTVTVSDLIQNLNSNLSGLFYSSIIDPQFASTDADNLTDEGPDDISTYGSQAVYDITFTNRILREYTFAGFPTLGGLVSAINSYWTPRGVTAAINSQTQSYPTEAVTANLSDNTANGGVNVYNTTVLLAGQVHSASQPTPPTENVTYDFNIRFAVGGNPNELAGIQVALGGYESDGVFYPFDSPNTFFEPGYNSLFPIQFNVLNADTIYLLVRSRQNLEGTIYTSEESDYAGIARFSNGYPSQTLIPSIPTESKFTNVWTESNLGDPPTSQVPVMLAITGAANQIEVFIDDIQIPDSIHVAINNSPDVLDEFGFLAINRSNLNGSMTESRSGRVFGMVLDNRGIWDVLIGPEAEIEKVQSGNFNHLGMSYERTPLDSDEAYDFEFNNLSSLPAEVRSAISLIPVPGYPQVWILRIERGVKQYLASLREEANRNSQDGCSINIDMLVTGRTSEVQGICRVTVFYDVYCVFDVELCDAFWNLTDPPEPPGPPLIEDQLEFSYQSLIDCERLELEPGGTNTELSVPILCNIRNIPMFENGNALLLIKSFYSAEIQGFYFPLGEDLSNIVFEDCTTIGSNVPLYSKLNKTLLYLPGQTEPITDPIEIQNLIETEESYLYVKPAFQFPSTDPKKDCGQDEVVIAALGYQFKNWKSGLREDNILFGVDMVIPGGVYVAPELQLCYRYYYDQEET